MGLRIRHLAQFLCTLMLAGALLPVAGCNPSSQQEPMPPKENPPLKPTGKITHNWNPKTGRGTIVVTPNPSTRMDIRIQDRFDGYRGGLTLGSMNRPAYTVQRNSLDTEKPAAVWCAQDESIVVQSTGLEYNFGWSENVGTGADGIGLQYLEGTVLEDEPTHVLLASRNGAAPFMVDKWMYIDANGLIVVRTQIRNVSLEKVTFDLWSGDDPWVGDYGTSRGDVGYTETEWIKTERRLSLGARNCIGMADLQQQRWSTANFFCLGPNSPLPNAVYVANSFAHKDADITPGKKLNAKTLTGFNMGWTGLSLQPNDSFDITYAMGVVPVTTTQTEKTLPPIPTIDNAAWESVHTHKLPFKRKLPATAPILFFKEKVEMHLLPQQDGVRIEGDYYFKNQSNSKQFQEIYFPFAIDKNHPYPGEIQVSNTRFSHINKGILFPLQLDPNEIKMVHISYTQKSLQPSATYIVTSARNWRRPLDESVLKVHAPCNQNVDISYAMTEETHTHGHCIYSTTLAPFFPDKEFAIHWEKKNNTDSAL